MKKIILFLLIFGFSVQVGAETIRLPHIFTFIKSDDTTVEQKQVLTESDIEELHVSDLPSLMVAAGIQILSYGPYGLEQKPSIRGFTDETVRVIIDGICVNNAQYGTFDFSSLNVEDIERIEIVRGGFTEGVSDEGAVGGAIYIFTKKQGLGHHIFFNSEAKSFFNLNQLVDCISQSVGYNGQFSDADYFKCNFKGVFAANRYFFRMNRNGDFILQERKNASVKDCNASLNFLHYFGDGNSFSVKNLSYFGNKNIPGPVNSMSPGLQRDFNNNFSVQVVNPSVLNIFRLENCLSWISSTRFYQEKSVYDSRHFVNSFKYFGNISFDKNRFYENLTGVTFDFTMLDSTDDGKHNQFGGTFKNTFKFKNIGDSPFVFSFPVAISFCNENFACIPKIGGGVQFAFADVFVNAYKMVQFPNMDDLYWNDGINTGNPDLLPENGYGAEVAVNLKKIPVNFSFFTNFYENKIQWANVNGAWTPANVASAFYAGADFKFEKKFFNDSLSVSGNGEYLFTRLLKKDSNFYGNRIMWTPDFVASFSCTKYFGKNAGKSFENSLKKNDGKNADVSSEKFFYKFFGKSFCDFMGNFFGKFSDKFLRDSSLSFDVNYMGKRYCSNLNLSYMKPYFLVNVIAESVFDGKGKDASWKIVPYFRIDNLLNVSYEAVENYPMPGFSLSVGCRFSR